jgi:probable rRNA maturation factor
VPKKQLREKTSRLLNALGVSPAELSILLVDDPQIHQLNKKWRTKDRPTDVLSFAQREGKAADPDDPVLGDIVISVERAQAQADERGHSRSEELDLLLVHGLLHLLGYEHEGGGKRAQKMRAQEKKLLAVLNKK